MHFVKFHAHATTHATLRHRDAVQLMARLHGAFVVGNDDEVALIQEGHQRLAEALHVGFIERGVHFVEDAEGARLGLEDRHHQRNGGHRLLATAELADETRLFAGWLRANLNATLEPVGFA